MESNNAKEKPGKASLRTAEIVTSEQWSWKVAWCLKVHYCPAKNHTTLHDHVLLVTFSTVHLQHFRFFFTFINLKVWKLFERFLRYTKIVSRRGLEGGQTRVKQGMPYNIYKEIYSKSILNSKKRLKSQLYGFLVRIQSTIIGSSQEFFHFLAQISSAILFNHANFTRHILAFSSYAPPKW